MTERLNCGNCGGPLTRQSGESSIKCPHCEHITEVGSPPGADDDDSSPHHDHGHIPAIIVINAGGSNQPQRPAITRTVVVSRRSGFGFIAPLIFIAIAVGASLAIRRHIMNSISSIPAAHEPPAAAGHEPPKHDEHGKHGH